MNNLVREEYFRKDNQRYEYPDGISVVDYVRDKSNKFVTTKYYNMNMKLVPKPSIGASIIVSEADIYGRLSVQKFFDSDSLPINNVEGAAEIRFDYLSSDIEKSYFDVNNNLVLVSNNHFDYLSSITIYERIITAE